MAKLYAKITSNNKPSRSITSDEIIKIELSHKNRLVNTIFFRIDNGESIVETKEQKPKV